MVQDDQDKTPDRKSKKVKNKKELFKSLGLEDSSSCSNFDPNFGISSPTVKSSETKSTVFSFLSTTGPEKLENDKLIQASKEGDSKSKELETCRNSNSILKDEGSNSGKEQQSFKRILNFSPEHLQLKYHRKSESTVRNLKSPTGKNEFSLKKTFPASNNRSTGLSLSNQILASYGLSESHSLQPIRDLNSKQGFKTTNESARKIETKPEKIISGLTSKSGSKSEKKLLNDGFKESKSDYRTRLKSEKSKTLLALCGLEDSPDKRNTEETSYLARSKPTVKSSSSVGTLTPIPSSIPLLKYETEKVDLKKITDKETSHRHSKKPRLTMTTQSLASIPPKEEAKTLNPEHFGFEKMQTQKEKTDRQAMQENKNCSEENEISCHETDSSKKLCPQENQELFQETFKLSSDALRSVTLSDASFTPSVVATSFVGSQSGNPEFLGTNPSALNVITPASTSVEKKSTKRKRVCLSFSTKVLASCRPDDNEKLIAKTLADDDSDKKDIKAEITTEITFDDKMKTVVIEDVKLTKSSSRLSTSNKNLASSLKQNVTSQEVGKTETILTSSSKLRTPQKNLASSLGLDLSSSSDDDDVSKTRKSPRKQFEKEEKVKVEDVAVLPKKKKKVQLGLSTKENRVDFVYQN